MVHVGNPLLDSAVEMIDIGEGLMRKEVALNPIELKVSDLLAAAKGAKAARTTLEKTK